jgi:hypothetical protein
LGLLINTVYMYSDQPQKKLKKTIFTLGFDSYTPEVVTLTLPFLKRFADKISADLRIINERKFPDYPVMYEKLQIYELGKDNDWNYYIDPNCLVHPDLFDITEVLPEDTVLNFGVDFAGNRFCYDNFFRRDGRNISSTSFLTVASHLCHDIWEPLTDMTTEEALKNITIGHNEEMTGLSRGHGIDDYVISRNIAKYGIKFKTFLNLLNEIGRGGDEYIYYDFSVQEKDRAEKIREKLKSWKYL